MPLQVKSNAALGKDNFYTSVISSRRTHIDESATELSLILSTPSDGRAEITIRLVHSEAGDRHTHWMPIGLIKLNNNAIDFDDFCAELSGSNDAEDGNHKLDNILSEFIPDEWVAWFHQMQVWLEEDAKENELNAAYYRQIQGF